MRESRGDERVGKRDEGLEERKGRSELREESRGRGEESKLRVRGERVGRATCVKGDGESDSA